MKNNILLSFCLLLGIVLFSACTKKDVVSTSQNSTKAIPQFDVNWGCAYHYNPTTGKCPDGGNNCFCIVTITPSKQDAYDSFQTAVTTGPAAIEAYFKSSSWATVFPDLNDSSGNYPGNPIYLRKLQSGNYSIITSTVGSTEYFLCGLTGTFDSTDPEFVLQAND